MKIILKPNICKCRKKLCGRNAKLAREKQRENAFPHLFWRRNGISRLVHVAPKCRHLYLNRKKYNYVNSCKIHLSFGGVLQTLLFGNVYHTCAQL